MDLESNERNLASVSINIQRLGGETGRAWVRRKMRERDMMGTGETNHTNTVTLQGPVADSGPRTE